jgi:hypothetical protein
MTYQILGVGNNAKTIKGDGSEYVTAIRYLKPFKTMFKGKVHNLCAMAETAKCHVGCLNTAGRGAMNAVQRGRERKTMWMLSDPIGFYDALNKDIETFIRRQLKNGITPCIRLGGTDDKGDAMKLAPNYPDAQFYDYTKVIKRAYQKLPDNYHITLSYSEADMKYADAVVMAVVKTGVNMAVVFRDKLPDTFRGLQVIDGDKDDLRFLDPKGVVVGLIAKGKAKKDTSGFVIDTA